MAASSYNKNIRLSNQLQSAYKKHHSTESAVLKVKVQNDIVISIDKGEVTAHFDTIVRDASPNRLSDWYGISTYGQGQIVFSSYLQNRHQSVKIKDSLSDKVTLSRGSVLGPVFFILYTTPLSTIICVFDINIISMPVILKFTCLYPFPTLRNLLRSCNIV